jgi:hypothetical protein
MGVDYDGLAVQIVRASPQRRFALLCRDPWLR